MRRARFRLARKSPPQTTMSPPARLVVTASASAISAPRMTLPREPRVALKILEACGVRLGFAMSLPFVQCVPRDHGIAVTERHDKRSGCCEAKRQRPLGCLTPQAHHNSFNPLALLQHTWSPDTLPALRVPVRGPCRSLSSHRTGTGALPALAR